MKASLAAFLLVACGEPAMRTRDGVVHHDAATPRDAALDARRDESLDPPEAESRDAAADVDIDRAIDGAPASPDQDVRATTRTSIVDHDRWWRLPASDDPFPDRLVDVRCTPAAAMAEVLADERAYGVDTGACNYLTAEQPVQRAIAAGETIKVRLWHFALSASEPAQAHAAVWVDGIPVLDERVDIPGPGGLLVREHKLARGVALDAPVHFHLHNHGENSWALVEVSAGPADANR